jgi:transcriptional regulator with XRE-family HTH domain
MKAKQDTSIVIAQKIKQAREDFGLTQQQVAALLRRPQSYVSRCEKGIKQLDIQDLKEFSSIYKKPLSYFLDE